MKKILSMLLVVCLLLSACAGLTSCSHKCSFEEKWTTNEASHWHACTDKSCTNVADQADHVWDEGEITKKPADEADGEKTYTCTTCGYTKIETVVYTGMTEEEWNAALSTAAFENCTYEERSGDTMDDLRIVGKIKFDGDLAWVRTRMGSHYSDQTVTDAAMVELLREALLDSLKDVLRYEKFAFDPNTRTYKATQAITIPEYQERTQDITLTFSDGKLVGVEYTIEYTPQNVTGKLTAACQVIITDYGTTVVEKQTQ